jgi:hypothetical protein
LTLRLEDSGWFRAAAASVLVVLASIGWAAAASASKGARPVRGAYHGFDGRPAEINRAEPNAGFFDHTAALRVLSSPTGRLFMQYRLTSQGFMPYVFACLFEVDRRFPLGQSYDDQDVALPRLSGPFVAWVFECTAAGPCTGSIQVRDLRTGAFAHRRIFPTSPLQPYYSRFTDLELKDTRRSPGSRFITA